MNDRTARRERRRHRRVTRKESIRILKIGDRDEFEGRLENYSPGGAVVRCRPAYAAGSVVKLVIASGVEGMERSLIGRVVWARGIPEPGIHHVGLEFVEWGEVFEERRAHPRRDLKLFVSYRCLAKEQFDWGARNAMTENLSAGGVALIAEREYPAGTLLEVRVPKTPVGPERVARARVVRTDVATLGRWLNAARFEA
jgi:c-di-GMP-binding flagellar brake protein YcgR